MVLPSCEEEKWEGETIMGSAERIVKKIVCRVPIETKAPLRISSGFDDGIVDSLILKDKDGKAFIPATSLGGVLRSELIDIYGEEAVSQLMGAHHEGSNNAGEQSMLVISDIFLDETELIYRDGVKIDPLTGTGVQGAKFDFEALERGAKGNLVLELTLRGCHTTDKNKLQINYVHKTFEDSRNIYVDMMATIADLLTRGIHVGSLTTKGFGKIQCQKDAELYLFDFEEKGAKDKWLEYIASNDEVLISEVLNEKPIYVGNSQQIQSSAKKDLLMTIDFSLKSALIIRNFDEQTFDKEQQDNKIKAIQMKSKDAFLIPGTSIKGVLRNRGFDILMNLLKQDVVKVEAFLNTFMGYSNERTKESSKSKLIVDEVYIASKAINKMRHSRNRIDRFTGGTVNNALFSDEPIWQTDKKAETIRMTLRVKECSHSQAGLMLLILRDLWLGTLPVGGNKGIGRGVLQGRHCILTYEGKSYELSERDSFTVNGDKAYLESLVAELVGECNG